MRRRRSVAPPLAVLVVVLALSGCCGAAAEAVGAPAEAEAPLLLPCLDDVLPCTAYLGTGRRPPQTCCAALRRAAASEAPCLCRLLADPDMLATFNVTRDQAFGLPARCDLPVGCRAGGPGVPDPVVEAPPPPPAAAEPSPDGGSSGGDRCRSSVSRAVALVVLPAMVSVVTLM